MDNTNCKWVFSSLVSDGSKVSTCSNCNMQLVWVVYAPKGSGYNYCPGCGAKIQEFVYQNESEK